MVRWGKDTVGEKKREERNERDVLLSAVSTVEEGRVQFPNPSET